ncbi:MULTISPECIES: Tm-1-like ATP-binding domain-containing protein [unclassified Bradyrhizobium]|uniref:Tm-1-like ATP-binding domain-containing protein n=1 Tax=unclassified Bradyrhizobium TaxID=2631580 RepID=UPI0020B30959|nr:MULTISPECIES: Tm-1-like ATP-binding domain-containing protein [unclassified Bradyrhizobium]MCP3397138.1 Tm-1-like ATP-binding domain-containing protein [Bradyrhizobium sp. CCGB20]MCP3405651.1 Tm-1-like ATP-binding domain-containing protein [Bradyrhizobium sp. CCGB01]
MARLAEAGVDAIVFPANGSGGRRMEELIVGGEFGAAIDLTTTELAFFAILALTGFGSKG